MSERRRSRPVEHDETKKTSKSNSKKKSGAKEAHAGRNNSRKHDRDTEDSKAEAGKQPKTSQAASPQIPPSDQTPRTDAPGPPNLQTLQQIGQTIAAAMGAHGNHVELHFHFG